MNFLAHLYLSTFNDDFLTGSFVADSVKGRAISRLPLLAQQGVAVHREVDTFTDHHVLFRKTCHLLEPVHGRWSGVVTDIFFDHFLASSWDRYSNIGLPDFAAYCYSMLQSRVSWLPEKSVRILPYMTGDDWLTNYADTEFLNRVFAGMHRRTHFRSAMLQAVTSLNQYYNELHDLFEGFFPEVVMFAKEAVARLQPVPPLDFRHQLIY